MHLQNHLGFIGQGAGRTKNRMQKKEGGGGNRLEASDDETRTAQGGVGTKPTWRSQQGRLHASKAIFTGRSGRGPDEAYQRRNG